MASFAGMFMLSLGERAPDADSLPEPPVTSPEKKQLLLDLSLPDSEGRPRALAEWRGRVLVINYWATWCKPCRGEMASLTGLAERLAPKGVQVIGIAADDPGQVAEFLRATRVSYPILVGGPDAIRLTRDFGNEPQAVPFTLVIDRGGTVRAAVLGAVRESALERLLLSLL